MPTVTLALRSQRSKPVPDPVRIELRGAGSGPVQSGDIEIRPGGEIVLDLVPDLYTIDLEADGFARLRTKLRVEFDPLAEVIELENLVTRLPKVSEMTGEEKRLLQSLDDSKKPAEIWEALTDNKAATFFQVSHALTGVLLADGSALSTAVDRIVRVGG